MAGFFGAGSTLGPFGNAGPATSSNSSTFNPVFGEVAFGQPSAQSTIQAVVPTAVIAVFAGVTLWLVLK